MIQTINPATGESLNSYPMMDNAALQNIIEAAHQDYLKWRNISFMQRAEKLRRVAELLRNNKNKYAHLMAQEMGKPITSGESEVEKCAWVCEHYAEHAETLLKPQLIKAAVKKSYVCYEPQGLILGIMPWNFPMWQVFRFIAPNLMAGQGCLLKHARNVTGTALAIESLLKEAGLPENIFRALIIDTNAADSLIAHPKIIGVTLTGSVEAGKIIASQAGKYLKNSVLELGGNDPYIILSDADIEKAAEICTISRLNNSGQICIAAKRIIIVKDRYDAFKEQILKKVKQLKVGDPLNTDTQLGPLARQDLRDTVHQQVEKSVKQGAQLDWCQKDLPSKGFYYPVTVLSEVMPGMCAFDEEIFGPVVALTRADDENHAILLANQTEFGLGAAVFTQDVQKGETIAAKYLHAGVCAVNSLVHSDPRLPFGGVKHSGYGRELGEEGLKSFMNVKTVLIE